MEQVDDSPNTSNNPTRLASTLAASNGFGTRPIWRIIASTATVIAVAAVGLIAPATAHAAVTGTTSNITINPTTLMNGSSGQFCFDWGFASGTAPGDTATITSATDFTLSLNSVSPNEQQIFDSSTNLMATITLNGQELTITRNANTSFGDIGSLTPACLNFQYTGNIASAELRDTSWASSSNIDPTIIEITGAAPVTDQSWYSPRKRGSLSFNSAGEAIISWQVFSPVGPEAANSVVITDTLGPGHTMVCDGSWITGSVGSWDQSQPNGDYQNAGGFSWYGTPECNDNGFSGTVANALAAEMPGSNTVIPEDSRAGRVQYLHLMYTTKLTAAGLLQTEWTNTLNWSGTSSDRALSNTVNTWGSATGNRVINVNKNVTGYTELATGQEFELQVTCDVEGVTADGFPKSVLLHAGDSEAVTAPIGSLCEVTEPSTYGATPTYSAPVAVTPNPADSFALSVNNHFAEEPVTVQKRVDGPESAYEGREFQLIMSCEIDDEEIPGFPQQFSLEADESETVNAPVGAECVLTEPQLRGAERMVASPAILVTSEPSQAQQLWVTNYFAAETPGGGNQPPHEPGGSSTNGSGSGSLSSTGGDWAPLTVAATLTALLCAAGTLMLARRKSRGIQ